MQGPLPKTSITANTSSGLSQHLKSSFEEKINKTCNNTKTNSNIDHNGNNLTIDNLMVKTKSVVSANDSDIRKSTKINPPKKLLAKHFQQDPLHNFPLNFTFKLFAI